MRLVDQALHVVWLHGDLATVNVGAAEGFDGLLGLAIGFGRIVALHNRSCTLYQNHYETRCFYVLNTTRPNRTWPTVDMSTTAVHDWRFSLMISVNSTCRRPTTQHA